MSAFSSVETSFPSRSRSTDIGAHVWLGIGVDEELARGRQRDGVVGVLGREQRQPLAIHADAVEVAEIRDRARLRGRRPTKYSIRFCSSTLSSCVTLPSPVVILCLQLARGEVVEIEVAPVVAFREPDHFVGSRQIAPVDPAVARFEERLGRLVHDLADGAGRWRRRREAIPACDRVRSTRTRAAEPSGCHWTSCHSPPHHTSSHSEERC